MSGDEAAPDVAKVTKIEAKMPKFLPDHPAIFFVMAEAQFTLRSVKSDEAKYAHILSALPPEVIIRVADLVTTPPATDKYEAIKQRLTRSFAKTPAERATRLLEMQDLGGKSPLAQLDEMRHLSSGENLDFLLRAIFLRTLPEEVRRVVRDSTRPLDELAAAAEDHFTKAGAAIDPRRSVCAAGKDADDADSVAAFRRHQDRSGSKSSTPREKDICRFHHKFGASAKNCIAPCRMAPQSNPAAQRRPGNADAGGK